jgi:imidazole glycerol phosphate synthase subunit HisF
VQSGTTYTFVATDCGKTILFTSNSAVTATIPASIAPVSGQTCIFTPIQGGTAKVSVNGTAVTAATLVSAHSYTGTSGTQGSAISIDLTTVGGTATAYLLGDGS